MYDNLASAESAVGKKDGSMSSDVSFFVVFFLQEGEANNVLRKKWNFFFLDGRVGPFLLLKIQHCL